MKETKVKKARSPATPLTMRQVGFAQSESDGGGQASYDDRLDLVIVKLAMHFVLKASAKHVAFIHWYSLKMEYIFGYSEFSFPSFPKGLEATASNWPECVDCKQPQVAKSAWTRVVNSLKENDIVLDAELKAAKSQRAQDASAKRASDDDAVMDEVVALATKNDVSPLAAGTDLLGTLKPRSAEFKDLNTIVSRLEKAAKDDTKDSRATLCKRINGQPLFALAMIAYGDTLDDSGHPLS